MTTFIQTLTMTYLLYPILGLLLIGIGIIVAKKNAMLSNKRLVTYELLAILIMTTPALLGFLNYHFMPYCYIGLGVFYLFLGWNNVRILPWVLKVEFKYWQEILLTSFTAIVSMLFFVLVFNLCNELKFGLWASSCILPFVLVSIFIQSYLLYMQIPLPVYQVWQYDKSSDVDICENIDYNRLTVITFEIFKNESESSPTRINAKVAQEMPFGVWFKRLITDYNIKFPASPIDPFIHEENGGWIFYYKPYFLLPRRYIDFTKSFKDNKICSSRYNIIAKRVKEVNNIN